VLNADFYLGTVETLITRYRVDRYLAHRKEADCKLDLVERIGIRVVRSPLPLEIMARRGPVGRTILSFPSTVVHTLPVVLAESQVGVVVCEIPSDGYESQATARADRLLGRVTTSNRGSYGLATVAY
jgi:hypothetical protein